MTKRKSNSPGRDSPSLVFRNDRLLIGWCVTGRLRTEAWLGEIGQEEAAIEHSTNEATTTSTEPTTANRLRVYTSSGGSSTMSKGVAAVNETHPAVLQPHADETALSSSDFRELGANERMKLFENRLAGVKNGQ